MATLLLLSLASITSSVFFYLAYSSSLVYTLFFPRDTKVATAGLLLPTLAIGFVAGQLIHILSVFLERWIGLPGHRKLLADNLRNPTVISRRTAKRFYRICQWEFIGIGLTGHRVADSWNDDLMDMLYVHVRSYVDFDGRGRSQIFQAIYAFCRSLYLSSILLGGIYVIYIALLVEKGSWLIRNNGSLTYIPKISIFNFPPMFLLGVLMFRVLTSYVGFSRAKSEYRRYFIQYLVCEFLLMYDNH